MFGADSKHFPRCPSVWRQCLDLHTPLCAGRFCCRSLFCELEKLKLLSSALLFVFLLTQTTALQDAFIWFPFTGSRNARLPSEPTVCRVFGYQLSVNLSTLDFCWPFKQFELINGTQRGSIVKLTKLWESFLDCALGFDEGILDVKCV